VDRKNLKAHFSRKALLSGFFLLFTNLTGAFSSYGC
jgi:hypothetical protein